MGVECLRLWWRLLACHREASQRRSGAIVGWRWNGSIWPMLCIGKTPVHKIRHCHARNWLGCHFMQCAAGWLLASRRPAGREGRDPAGNDGFRCRQTPARQSRWSRVWKRDNAAERRCQRRSVSLFDERLWRKERGSTDRGQCRQMSFLAVLRNRIPIWQLTVIKLLGYLLNCCLILFADRIQPVQYIGGCIP